MSNDQVTKVYELRTIGYDQVSSELQELNDLFIQIRKSKQNLAKTPTDAGDSAALEERKQKLQELLVAEKNLQIQQKERTNEAKALQLIRQQEINAQKQSVLGNQAEMNSIADIRKQLSELRVFATQKNSGTSQLFDFRGDLLSFDAVIAKMKELSADEQAFRRQFQKDGTLVGEYTTGIIKAFTDKGLGDLVGGQISKAQARLTELDSTLIVLKEELSTIGVTSTGNFGILENELIANRTEAIALQKQLSTLQTEFRGTGDIGNQITTSLGEGFKSVKNQIGQLLLGYFGFQAAFQGLIGGVETTKELSDQTTNLQIELGTTTQKTTALVDELAKLNTRTKLTVLEDIANIAAKAGVGADQLVSVTQAIDKIKTAFGKDFGDVEQGTESLVKIVNIFEGTDQVTGDNLLKVGNAIRTLANESVASVPFINDFTKRMAGLKGISDISLPSVLGLASGFEQFGQTAEVSSTALVRIIPKIAADTEKFAAVAGLTREAFSNLLNTNPAEALLQVSQGFLQGKASIEEFESSFKDSGLGSGRVSSVIGVLGKNADAFRKSIDSAGQSFANTTNIEEAFTAKNENLAGSLDKITKAFSDVAGSKLFQGAVAGIAAIITLIIGNLPILLSLASLMAIAWAANNTQLLLLNLQLFAYNLQIAASYIALGALTIAQLAYNTVLLITNTTIGLVNKALQFFGVTIKATSGPLGILLTVVGLLGIAYEALGRGINTSIVNLSRSIQLQQISAETHREGTKAIGDQVAKIDGWVEIIKSSITSADTKNKAMQSLIETDKAFSGVVKDNVIDLNALTKAYDQVITKIEAKADAEAAATLSAGRKKDVLEVSGLRQNIESQVATNTSGQSVTEVQVTDAEKAILDKTGLQESGALISIVDNRAQFLNSKIDEVEKVLKVKENELTDVYKLYLDNQAKKTQELADVQNNIDSERDKTAKAGLKNFDVDILQLQTQLQEINKQIDSFQGAQKDLDVLIQKRSAVQAQLDQALHEGATNHGAKLTGDQRDALKDVDAARDEQLAEENLLHQQGLDDESTYLREILDINQAAIDKKLTLLKGANAEERKVISELQLERITLEQETNQKIFEARERAMKIQLDQEVKAAQDQAKAIIDNPLAAPTAKSQAKLDSDNTILAAQQATYNKLLALEKQYNIAATDLNKQLFDQIHKTQVDITNDTHANALARIDDIKEAAARIEAEFNLIIDKNEAKIQANNSLSQIDKDDQIREQENDRKVGILARQSAEYKLLADEFKQAYDKGLITLQEYTAIVDKLQQLQNQVAATPIKKNGTADNTGTLKDVHDLPSLTTLGIDKIFDVDKDSQEGKAVSKAVVDAYSTMESAMNSFFNEEAAQIKANLKLKEDQLDAEEKQVLARAQSQAEVQSIEDQYAAKKQKAEQDALNEEKKLKRAQAAIAFATEIANIWSGAASLGPIAGPILAGVEAGLALVRYEENVATINSQTAAHGISIGPDGSTIRGGRVKGRPHSKGGNPFIFKGRVFEDEVDELNVIRTKSAPVNKTYHISGNHTQIASALNELGGGDRFAPGAHVMRLATGGSIQRFDNGGAIGESLQPPVFNPTSAGTSSDISSLAKKFDEMNVNMVRLAEEQSSRIDRLQVIQDTETVTKSQKKRVKQSKIGSL